MEFIDDSSYFEILLKFLHNAGLINMINMICLRRSGVRSVHVQYSPTVRVLYTTDRQLP